MELMQWKLDNRKIAALKPLKKNPRQLDKHNEEHLTKSLEKFGICDFPVINTDNTIIGGHQRIKTLKKLGYKEIPVLVADRDMSSEEVEELNIRLNKNTGDWDWDKLANEWDPTELIEYGFTLDELDIEIDFDEEETTPEEEIEKPKEARTALGDLYQLGKHRLLCGDSTNEADVNRLLDGNIPILMVTDPPYGVNYDASWRSKALPDKAAKAEGKVQNDNQVDWYQAWSLFPGDIAYVWHGAVHTSEVQDSLKRAEFLPISQIIWVKQNFAISRGDYHYKHEPCWYLVRKGKKHNWQGSRKETSVWEISSLNGFGMNKEEDEERTDHSTQKPIECMAKPIRNNTQEGQGVYDPFVGSGTTIIASEKNNRLCYAMELDPLYCDICVQRWVNYKVIQKEDFTILKNGEPIEWLKKN